MKKFFVLLLALTFVFSMAAFAVADDGGQGGITTTSGISISGDARLRGVWNNNYTADVHTNSSYTAGAFNSNTDADVRYWDQRFRLKLVGNVGSGIEFRARLTTDDDMWDGAENTGGTMAVDYAYLHIPVGNYTVDAGRIKRSFGNGLYIKDATRDTFQVTTSVGDTQIGLFTDKMDDSSVSSNAIATNSGATNLEDDDNYGVFVNHSAGNLQAGIIIVREDYNAGPSDTAGTETSVYLNTSVGAIAIASEATMTTGNISGNEDSSGNNRVGAFVSASTDVGAIGVSLTAAMAKDSFAADSHFTPLVFFGTDNPTAIANFASAANSTTWAVIVGASTDVSSDLSVSGKLAYLDLENLATTLSNASANTGKERATEIDLGLSYKLADNATYSIDLGYLIPNDITTQDDNALALTHKVEVSF